MDFRKLVRDHKKVFAYTRELADGRVVTTKGVKIYIPSRFAERGLAQVGIETYIVGVYAMVADDTHYAVSMVDAMTRIEPTSTLKILIDEDEYFEFTFDPGSVIFPTLELVKSDTLVYKIYDEIIAKGRVPWYLEYSDLGHLFDTAKKHAGANIGLQHEVTELLVSMIARYEPDRHRYYRTVPKVPADLTRIRPAYIPLRSVTYAATNTTNRIAGSYFNEGMISSLVNPAERTERMEEILRQ